MFRAVFTRIASVGILFKGFQTPFDSFLLLLQELERIRSCLWRYQSLAERMRVHERTFMVQNDDLRAVRCKARATLDDGQKVYEELLLDVDKNARLYTLRPCP